jgi:hypothetical protein
MCTHAVVTTPMAANASEAAHKKFAQLIAHWRSPEAHQMSYRRWTKLPELGFPAGRWDLWAGAREVTEREGKCRGEGGVSP